MAKKIIFVAGGGTGGHIYPGLAIAKALQKHDASIEIHFIGTPDGLEKKIIPREGYELHLIQGGKLNYPGHLLRKIKTVFLVGWGFFQAALLLLKYKPRVVLGVGGYASAPLVLMASVMGFPTAIWEPNALPGLANRWLSRFVKNSYIVFEEAKKFLKSPTIKKMGMPIRKEIERAREGADYQIGAPIRVLHFGGSQGSRAIGMALSEAITGHRDWASKYLFVHQTGALDFEKLKEKYKDDGNLVEVKEFIYDMPEYYKRTDLVICRGGASTLNEIAAFGLPAIVIPLPAADGHQEKNARALESAGAVRVLLQKDLSPERLMTEIDLLTSQKEQLVKMSSLAKKFYEAEAAEKLAFELVELGKI